MKDKIKEGISSLIVNISNKMAINSLAEVSTATWYQPSIDISIIKTCLKKDDRD